MHDTLSTCNPSIVWPSNAESMSGLRAIPISQYMNSVTPPTPSNRKSSFSSDSPYYTKTRKDSFSAGSRDSRSNSLGIAGGKDNQRFFHDFDSGISTRKKRPFNTLDFRNVRQKREPVIIPEGKRTQPPSSFLFLIEPLICHLERKAFFAIISLLIDPASVDPNEPITDENYESFIPSKFHSLIERLKS